MLTPNYDITIIDLNGSSLEDNYMNEYEEPMLTFQNCFNHFFNNKSICERFEDDEIEKYYLLQETNSESNLNVDKKKVSVNKLFSSEINYNPNKQKKKLFQINQSLNKINNDLVKQKN